jgi:hypothetical protein
MRKFKSDEIKQIEEISRKIAAEMLAESKEEKTGKKPDKRETK